MDTTPLVKEAQSLLRFLDKEKLSPRAMILVKDSETGFWRLWIVPSDKMSEKALFYKKISSIIVKNRKKFTIFGAADIDLRSPSHPVIEKLSKLARVEDFSVLIIRGYVVDGLYIPEIIVLRSTL